MDGSLQSTIGWGLDYTQCQCWISELVWLGSASRAVGNPGSLEYLVANVRLILQSAVTTS